MNADYLVTVCAACLRASCWHGTFMCDESRASDVVSKRASELRVAGREHPEHYSRARLLEVCGEVTDAPVDGATSAREGESYG